MPKEQEGIITSLMPERNYGFLTPVEREGEEIFFHQTATTNFELLVPGDIVIFIEVKATKGNGKRALKVRKK